jgi:methylglutaconyl-CoA hydratase
VNYIEIKKTDSIYYVILNRPDKKNALNLEMITELSATFSELEKDDSCKLIVIKGAGDMFSSGADLSWMQKQIDQTFEENLNESNQLFDMFNNLSRITKPVVSYVHKYVMGGAIGLVACSDYCFAEDQTKFCFSETKFGLAPSVISPFVLAKCNFNSIQKQMLFAEFFEAKDALAMGLVHAVAPQQDLAKNFESFIKHLASLDLHAVRETKKLIQDIKKINFEDYRNMTTNLISKIRVQEEAQSRLKEFLEKTNS